MPQENIERDVGIEDPSRDTDGKGEHQGDAGKPHPARPEHACHKGAIAGPRHARVQFALHIMIECAGATGSQNHRQSEHRNLPIWQGRARRHRHAGHRTERDGRTDAQFEHI